MSTTVIRRWSGLAAALAGLALVAALVVRTSSAAFTDTTSNNSNSFTAGTVVLDDTVDSGTSASGSSVFVVSDMRPGDVETGCVDVTYSGTLVNDGGDTDLEPVVFYSGGYTASSTDDLADTLSITVERLAGTCAGSATAADTLLDGSGMISQFDTDHNSYATALSTTWAPTSAPETFGFDFTVEFVSSGSDDIYQGESITDLTFTWEIRTVP